ncbi:MAG: type II toxin-antitoxin system RelE/ParE family toxin [Armatimonadetes bacterium]|nr:type II toxin-antitoxin system RelE/ParE family toxin [Armatimonadota bacterium]
MSRPVVFHPEAQDEMDEAYDWYERQSSGLGEAFLSAVRDVLDRIRQNPESYARIYREVRRGLTRRFPYGVLYRVEAERIVVLSIFHSHRDPRHWQERI